MSGDPAVSALVLAGGASRRMGRDKAAMTINGRALICIVTDALMGGGVDRVVWVGGPPAERQALALDHSWTARVDVIDDTHRGEGPLGGVVSGSAVIDTPFLVVPCDLPDLVAVDVEWLLAAALEHPDRPLVGVTDGRDRPDIAWWTDDALAEARAAFADGMRSLRSAQQDARWRRVPLGDGFRDADTPDDLADSDTVGG